MNGSGCLWQGAAVCGREWLSAVGSGNLRKGVIICGREWFHAKESGKGK